jgi:hypothetical protein
LSEIQEPHLFARSMTKSDSTRKGRNLSLIRFLMHFRFIVFEALRKHSPNTSRTDPASLVRLNHPSLFRFKGSLSKVAWMRYHLGTGGPSAFSHTEGKT